MHQPHALTVLMPLAIRMAT